MTSTPVISISLIIVNFGTAHLIVNCIRSIEKFNRELTNEIIVVNNDSLESEKRLVLKEFPGVIWIDMPYNAGFARANNAGMKVARGDVFLLLNPDTLSIDDSISRCYQQLIHSDFIASGVQLLNSGHQPQISGNFFVTGGLNHLLPIPYWGGLIRWLGYATKRKIPNVISARVVEEVDWISGAFLMVRKEAVREAGMMDEDFFLYAEEVEWCYRLRKIGRLCIFGDLHMIHLEGGSINKAHHIEERGYDHLYDKKGLQLMVSNHLRVRKQYGVAWFLFLLLNYSWGIIVFWLGSTLHRLFTLRNPVGDWPRIGAFAKNMFTLWSLAPRIILNKPHFYKMM